MEGLGTPPHSPTSKSEFGPSNCVCGGGGGTSGRSYDGTHRSHSWLWYSAKVGSTCMHCTIYRLCTMQIPVGLGPAWMYGTQSWCCLCCVNGSAGELSPLTAHRPAGFSRACLSYHPRSFLLHRTPQRPACIHPVHSLTLTSPALPLTSQGRTAGEEL